ncbi:MAG: hypothetical protein CBB72_006805 [Muricauda sp. TMED12]|nr:MAG: hypothetical protein CBB72_006805 [Muricauda sp. TMED12]
MTLLSPVLSDALNPALSGGTGAAPEQRYFTTFQGTNSHHIQFPDISLPTDSEWEVTVVAAVPDQGAYLLADRLNSDGQSRFGLLNDGRTFGLSDEISAIGGDTMGLKGGNKLRVMKAVADSGNINVTINSTLVHSYGVGNSTPVLNSIGRQYNGQTGVPPMMGVISLVQIEKAGILVLDMPINQEYTPSNNTVLDLSGQGNHGTFVGIEDGDSKLYTQNENGDWVSGEETLGGINN